MNKQEVNSKLTETEKALDNLLDLDLKGLGEEEIINLRKKVAQTALNFYSLIKMEINRRKKVKN